MASAAAERTSQAGWMLERFTSRGCYASARVLASAIRLGSMSFTTGLREGRLRASQVGAIKGSTSGNRTFIAEGT